MAEKRKQVDLIEFCRAWQNSDSPQEAADKTGLTKATVQQRATKYRCGQKDKETGEWLVRPINLKKMDRGGTRLADRVDEINTLIENGFAEPENQEVAEGDTPE